jgi:hypothetical protein
MRLFGTALAAGALLAGTCGLAQAATLVNQAPGVNSDAGSSWNGQDTSTFTPPTGTTAGTGGFGENQFNNTPNTVTFNSFVTTTPSLVTFESSNTSTGPFVQTNSSSTVAIGIHNAGGSSVQPTVASTISAAGLGFYIANTNYVDPTTGLQCVAASCPGTNAHTFADFVATGGSSEQALAGATFTFSIVADDRTIYSISGSAELFVGGNGSDFFVSQTLDSISGAFVNDETDLNDASHLLAGFTQTWATDSAFGYAWDATNIFPTFEDSIEGGGDGELIYQTDVSTFSRSFCLEDGSCIQAYSGFGDPVGRGGGVEDLKAGGFSNFAKVGGAQSAGGGVIQGVNFTPSSFLPPTFNDGVLTFTPGGVPEPANWAMMILGFGVLGAALRRRRVLAYN